MNENERLIQRFASVVSAAVAHASTRCSLEDDDLRQFAYERILTYGTGEGWLSAASPVTPRELRSDAPPELDKYVQQALNGDLANYARDDDKQRSGASVSLEAAAETGKEAALGLTYTNPEPGPGGSSRTGPLGGSDRCPGPRLPDPDDAH